MKSPKSLPSWGALEEHFSSDMKDGNIPALFRDDHKRFDRFSIEAGDLFLDYSKNLLNDKTLTLLAQLAQESGVKESVEAMFTGETVNITEGRSALHVALRSQPEDKVGVDVQGVDQIWPTLKRLVEFSQRVIDGELRGASGRKLTQIVNIGIGGSDLGPVMAAQALRDYWISGMTFHSVSNVDGFQLRDIVNRVDPAEILFVICSKSFTTQETLLNARNAHKWVSESLGADAIGHHFAAVSTNHDEMNEFGINADYRFEFWDWVGGRYSLWSSIGLSLALVVGADRFLEMLDGARRMDQHFRSQPFNANMPVLLALISVWYNNFFGAETSAILPYSQRLDRFPAFLQQLHMESNGKRVMSDGSDVTTNTGTIIWGEPGTNAQHSFYQLLHQGTRFVPVDFVLPVPSEMNSTTGHAVSVANCLAQAEALMDGYQSTDPHRFQPGNRPSNTILLRDLSPASIGQLVALYEHKVYVEACIWGINAFDQFGVELGKRLASEISSAIDDRNLDRLQNPSTAGLVKRLT